MHIVLVGILALMPHFAPRLPPVETSYALAIAMQKDELDLWATQYALDVAGLPHTNPATMTVDLLIIEGNLESLRLGPSPTTTDTVKRTYAIISGGYLRMATGFFRDSATYSSTAYSILGQVALANAQKSLKTGAEYGKSHTK